MALVICDGFGHYDTAHIPYKWDVVPISALCFIGTTGGRYGTYCMELTSGTDGVGAVQKNFSSRSTLICGAAVLLSSITQVEGSNILFGFYDSATMQCNLSIRADGALVAYLGNTTTVIAATASGLVKPGIFNYVEFSVSFSTGLTGAVTIRLNGNVVGSATNVITCVSVDSYATGFALACGAVSAVYNDFYLCDGTGTANSTFLGDVKVVLATPNYTYVQQFAPYPSGTQNWADISEIPPHVPSPDDDATYVYSSTVGQLDQNLITSIGTPTAIVALQLVTTARMDNGGGSRVLGTGLGNPSGSTADSGTSLSTNYSMIRFTLDQNPWTHEPWVIGDFTELVLAYAVNS